MAEIPEVFLEEQFQLSYVSIKGPVRMALNALKILSDMCLTMYEIVAFMSVKISGFHIISLFDTSIMLGHTLLLKYRVYIMNLLFFFFPLTLDICILWGSFVFLVLLFWFLAIRKFDMLLTHTQWQLNKKTKNIVLHRVCVIKCITFVLLLG